MKADGTHQNTIFNFDSSMSPMDDDIQSIGQLFAQLALPVYTLTPMRPR